MFPESWNTGMTEGQGESSTNSTPDLGCNGILTLNKLVLCTLVFTYLHSHSLVGNLFFRPEALFVPGIPRKFE